MQPVRKVMGRVVLATVATAGALAIPAAAQAATVTVNDNAAGAGPTGATCADADFASIQDAIDASTAGDTVLVCAGQYPESVNVSKQLTLQGAKSGVDARSRSGASGESVITSDAANEGGVAFGASGITLDGFVVANGADPAIGAGIAMPATFGNQTVTNNVVTDNTIGISANNADNSPSTISKNKFVDNNVPGAAAGNAIYGDSNVDDLTISQNSFSNQTNAAILFTGTAPTATNDNVTISQNTFSGTASNPARNELRVLLLYTSNSSIADNSFQDMNNNAVQLADGNENVTVSGNDIDGGGFAGVRVTDFGGPGENTGISIVGNTLRGNDAGVNVAPDGLSGALTVRGNRIVGNTSGGILMDDVDGTVNAANNWWGCNEGPGNPGCDIVGGANAAAVTSTPVLTFGIEAPAQIKAKKTKTITATLAGGSSCEFPDGTLVSFATDKGTLGAATALTQDCVATTSLTARGKGTATVTATLDNETVTDTVKFKKKRKKKN